MDKVRIDKWLWAVRVHKTRSMATNACNAGKVKIAGNNARPSYQLKVGEEVQFTKNRQKHLYRVVKLIDKRVAAPDAQACYEDITPQEWILAHLPSAFTGYPKRDKGEGRPTKKQRRDLDKFTGKP